MTSSKGLSRMVLLSLLFSAFSLSVAPAFSVQAQELAPRQAASSADSGQGRARRTHGQKTAEAEITPLSEEEMEGVEGQWVGAAIGVAVSVAIGAAQIWQSNHNAHGHPSEINIRTKKILPGLYVAYPQFRHNIRR